MHNSNDLAGNILSRLGAAGVSAVANSNIADHLRAGDLEAIEVDVAARFETVLDALVIERDHNTRETAKRVAKMYVREVFAGRYTAAPKLTEFPNVAKLGDPYTVGPIAVRSTCSHHFCPIEGELWCGVIAGERLIGLSKFARLARWVMARPQIQEEAAVQLADALEKAIAPRGLIIRIAATHNCMTWRGVMEHNSEMVTVVTRGILASDESRRAEVLGMMVGGRR